MSDQYKIANSEGVYFLTTTVVDWIDVFTRKEHALIVMNALKYCQEQKGLILHAYCLMPSHLHWIASAKPGCNLSGIIRDFKKFTSKEIVKNIIENPESRRDWMLKRFEYAGKFLQRVENYKFWQDNNQAKECVSVLFTRQKLEYIHNNPVEEMIVDEAEHYVFSSAKDYVEGKGLLKIDLLF
jgi:putative transposase